MHTLWQDIRYGARMLLKQKGLTAIAVLSLALGIGANTAIFSLADKLLFRSLPVEAPERLALLTSVSVSPHFVGNIFSYPDYADYRDQNEVFSGLITFSQIFPNMQTSDRTERVPGEIVSGNYFDVLGVKPMRGRAFLPEENTTPGTHPVAVISYGLWQRQFGADLNLIGKTITLDDLGSTVIGVAPRGFNGTMVERTSDIWVPMMMQPHLIPQGNSVADRRISWMRVMGRLRDGVSIAQAEAGIDVLAQQIKQAHNPQSAQSPKLPYSEQHIKLEPGGRGISGLRGELSQPLMLLLAVVGSVLLIACANVANLLLARSLVRRKEIAVRLALGASRARLVRQLLTESILLAFVCGAVGLVVAPWITSLLLRFQPTINLAQTTLGDSIDARVLAFTLFVALLSGIVFGLVPALQSSRTDLIPALKDERVAIGRGESRFGLRNLLVIAQISLALMVLIGAGLFLKSLRNLFAIDPGYKTEDVLLVPLSLDSKNYDEAKGRGFYQQLMERIRALPGVAAVSSAKLVPLGGSWMTMSVFVEGYTPLPDEETAISHNFVGPEYHQTMGIPLVQGRGFTEQDRVGAPGVVIINEAMARRFFAGQNAIGKRLRLSTEGPSLEIIGVARDGRYQKLTEEPAPYFYLPSLQQRYVSLMTLHVRATNPELDLLPAVRREVQALDPTMPISNVRTLAEQLSVSLATARMATTLTGLFGLLALLLAGIGIYGVMAYSVAQRAHEIGIRMALGAQTADVLKMILRQGMTLVLLGVVLGLAGAYVLTRYLESLINLSQMLYGVKVFDPLTYGVIVVLLTMVALFACFIPVRRATKVEPVVALRYE
ncbi:MAG: ABC transporter permease [Acidobacteriota bacterium]|nr:ABC transporter permease [Acidobacteriota bacterium]